MKLPRDVYGRDVAAALCRSWGYTKVNQVGSHIILQTEDPAHHRISIPDHKPYASARLTLSFGKWLKPKQPHVRPSSLP